MSKRKQWQNYMDRLEKDKSKIDKLLEDFQEKFPGTDFTISKRNGKYILVASVDLDLLEESTKPI